jgi:hypothetical protein
MTLDTRIYIHGPADYREVFVKCNQLIGADEGVRFEDKPGNIWNKPGQGLCALLDVYYGQGGTALRKPGDHARYCDGEADECFSPCGVPCWLEVSFDTAYGYRGPEGGCGDLHARLVAELGRWLDGKGVRWSWQNEFTGEIHQGYEGLDGLASGGAEASSWFREIVAPALGLPS